MDRTDIIIEYVRDLMDKYGKDPEIEKEFCEYVEEWYFSKGETEENWDADIVSWRKRMPPIGGDNVEIFYDGNNELILSVTGTNDDLLNDVYANVITSKVVEQLESTPEIAKLNPTCIGNGDGDEGCIYFEFEGGDRSKRTRHYVLQEMRKIEKGFYLKKRLPRKYKEAFF